MKKLVLIRHAKSSWEFNLEDRDRPLSKKGIKRIKQMAMHNPEIFSSSEIIFSSTANRATHTTSILVNSLLISFKTVNLVEDLYTFEASKVIDFLKKLSDKYESVICVGHNPAFTDAASYLSNTELDYLIRFIDINTYKVIILDMLSNCMKKYTNDIQVVNI